QAVCLVMCVEVAIDGAPPRHAHLARRSTNPIYEPSGNITKMSVSSFHMIKFALSNPAAFSLDPDGPIPFVYRPITAKRLSATDLDLTPFRGKRILIVGSSSDCRLECARILAQ